MVGYELTRKKWLGCILKVYFKLEVFATSLEYNSLFKSKPLSGA